MTEAKDVTRDQVERAMEWAGPPLAELFNSPMKLKPHDLVTMKLSQLGHMLAWYAELQRPRMRFTEPPKLAENLEPSYHSYLLASGEIDDDRSLGEG